MSSASEKVVSYKRESPLPVKREESEPFGVLRREIDRLFDNFTHGFMTEPFRMMEERMRPFSPCVDVKETEKDITVTAELPGMDEKDIELSITDDHLMIRGEKKEEKEEKKKGYYRLERSFGEFSRSIPLPAGVDKDKATAAFKKGILNISIPKTKEAQAAAKKIPIKSE